MVKGGDSRSGAPVVSVADLIARDAPWSGAPEAVDVTGGPAAGIPAQRASSRPNGARPGGARPAGARPAALAAARPRKPAVDLLRRFVVAAWSPNWRFITICAGVLVAGLLSNVVLLATVSTPDHGAQAAGSEEGGFPADAVVEPPRLTVEPPPATLPGLGLPLALASLGQTVSTGDRAATPRSASALVSPPVGGGSVITGSGTGRSAGSGSASTLTSGSELGGAVSGVGRTLGNTVGDVGRALPEPLKSPVNGLGRTTKELTGTVGDTLDGVAEGLLGRGDSGDPRSSDEDSESGSSRSDRTEGSSGSGGGGVLGGVGGLLRGEN